MQVTAKYKKIGKYWVVDCPQLGINNYKSTSRERARRYIGGFVLIGCNEFEEILTRRDK